MLCRQLPRTSPSSPLEEEQSELLPLSGWRDQRVLEQSPWPPLPDSGIPFPYRPPYEPLSRVLLPGTRDEEILADEIVRVVVAFYSVYFLL